MQGQGALCARIRDGILHMIAVEGLFKPGDKLPNEFELAQKFGVSRTTLREAVRMLASQGYLDVQRGRGTYVADSAELSGEFSLPGMKDARVNVKELYEMRLIFEPHAAYYAAKRASDAEIAQIAEYCEINEQMIRNNSPKWDQAEQQFHNAIASAAHNRFITSLTPLFNRAIRSGVILANESPIVASYTLQDHRYVTDYLLDRNAEGARAAMHLHIINTMRVFGVSLD